MYRMSYSLSRLLRKLMLDLSEIPSLCNDFYLQVCVRQASLPILNPLNIAYVLIIFTPELHILPRIRAN